MNRTVLLVLVLGGGLLAGSVSGQVEQKLALVDEKLDRLRAEVEALQFRQQKLQEDVDHLRAQLAELSKQPGGVTAAELTALEDRVKAIDAARERDKQVILDTLSKQLASIAGGNAGSSSASSGGAGHEVKPGETLSTIAKAYGVSVEALVRANGLSDPNALKVGQKLTIPK